MKFLDFFFVILLSAATLAEKARFDNYRVYSVEVTNELQLKVLKEIEQTSDSFDFWESPTGVPSQADIVVPPHQFGYFDEILQKFDFKATLMVKNLQENIDRESPKKQRKLAPGELDWDDYHSGEDIHAWIEALQVQFSSWITIEEIGKTYENRTIKLVKLSKKQNNRAVFIESNIHAREWISSAAATFFLNELLFSDDPEIQDLALNVDWYIIPILNLDGHAYTREINRNWRKSRSPVSLLCYGVDQNRNFAHNWLVADETGNEGASRAPCSDTYAGPHPFSESETTAVNNYLTANHGKFDVYLSFHSYGHYLLSPWGTTRVPLDNYDEHKAIGDAAAARLFAVDNIQYAVGSTIEILYAASGVSVDHALGAHQIPIGYTYEMRGNGAYGRFGFVLPKEFIIPNGVEVTQSLIGLVQKAREFGYLPVN